VGRVRGDQMVGREVGGLLEPEGRQRREGSALVGDGILEHHVEHGDAVGRDDQNADVVDVVEIADLARVHMRERDTSQGGESRASTARPAWARARPRSKHSSSRSDESSARTSGSSVSTDRNGTFSSQVRVAARCTARYASSRERPASTSASSTGWLKTRPYDESMFSSIRSGGTRMPAVVFRDCTGQEDASWAESARTIRSTEECEMSRSCHRAMSSSPAWRLERSTRASPHSCSDRQGLRLCGIALEPFWVPARKGSSTSRTSVRWRWRISRAKLSTDAPTVAHAYRNSAWRSRARTCVAGAGASPNRSQTNASTSGSTFEYVPTTPESLPTATLSRA